MVNAVSPSTRNDPKIRPSTVPMEVIMLKLDIIDGHLDSSVFSSIIIVDTGTLAIATIWNAIRTSIYSPIPVTNGMKIRVRNDPKNPANTNIFLLPNLSERLPQYISAGTDAADARAEVIPTRETLEWRYMTTNKGMSGVFMPPAMFENR